MDDVVAEFDVGTRALLEREKLAALAEFAAGAGHEINNPLAVIVGRAQLLLREEDHPDRRRDLATIASQAMRIHEMIADMMLFARPPQLRRHVCDASAIVDRLLVELAPRVKSQETQLMRVGESASIAAALDETQILVALRAVVDNALEALGRGGNIEVSVTSATFNDQPAVEFRVQDDGPGIAPEVRRHLFDPFYSGRQAGRGLGNGLSKCWRIATMHGGDVRVDSNPGAGATFTILVQSASC